MRCFYLIRLEALSLHAMFPEGQDAVLKAHCQRRKESVSVHNGRGSHWNTASLIRRNNDVHFECTKSPFVSGICNFAGHTTSFYFYCTLASSTSWEFYCIFCFKVSHRSLCASISLHRLSKSSPTDPMQKSKLSSDASFLLDFSLPWRLTIFKFSGERENKTL